MELGSKASSLLKLSNAGFTVPKFFTCNSLEGKEKIQSKLKYHLPNAKFFAVRSSSESEDTTKKSNAGQYYTSLAVKRSKVFEEIKKVEKSYVKDTGSVIVQEFIPSDAAGVSFTNISDMFVVNSTIGLCTPVVNGDACDEYVLDRQGRLIKKSIVKKPVRLFRKEIIRKSSIQAESLSEKKLRKLLSISRKIEKLFGTPQDIEWCFYKNKLYILQSRPITKDFSLKLETLTHYDSANISESYAGIVLPLTCTFASMAYSRIYSLLLANSGVSWKKLNSHKYIFDNLLGFFYGRMYYNMNNWYLMAAFVPGYERNKKNFEQMITSNVKEDIVTEIQPSFIFKLIYPLILVFKILTFGLSSRNFKFNTEKKLKKLNFLEFSKLDFEECKSLFKQINSVLLDKWYIAVENDFFVMTYHGILSKSLGKNDLQRLIVFKSKATEQLTALAKLSKKIQSNKLLWKFVVRGDQEAFLKELNRESSVSNIYKKYLEEYGGRFANELKLESVGIDEDISKLFSSIKAYKDYRNQKSIQKSTFKYTGKRKLLINFLLNQFKKYSSQREEFRLLRSNTFGVARKLFKRMGYILFTEGKINKETDIFYLKIEELLNSNNYLAKDLQSIIEKRKREYRGYARVNPPPFFSTVDNKPPYLNLGNPTQKTLRAKPASNGIVKGRVKVFKEFKIPNKIDFDIMVTSHTDPGWTSLIALSKGLIVEYGGVLSHASIVARELAIPAVIGATNATSILKDGQLVRIDGEKGTIKVYK